MDTNKKILIVDDSASMRQMIRGTFEEAGYKDVIEAGSGADAIKEFKAQKPDVVFLDIIMPDVNGIDVLRAIGRVAKVVVISAVGQQTMIDEAMTLGAFDYIVKPFGRDEILQKLSSIFPNQGK